METRAQGHVWRSFWPNRPWGWNSGAPRSAPGTRTRPGSPPRRRPSPGSPPRRGSAPRPPPRGRAHAAQHDDHEHLLITGAAPASARRATGRYGGWGRGREWGIRRTPAGGGGFHHATASRPFLATSVKSFSEAPRGSRRDPHRSDFRHRVAVRFPYRAASHRCTNPGLPPGTRCAAPPCRACRCPRASASRVKACGRR